MHVRGATQPEESSLEPPGALPPGSATLEPLDGAKLQHKAPWGHSKPHHATAAGLECPGGGGCTSQHEQKLEEQAHCGERG